MFLVGPNIQPLISRIVMPRADWLVFATRPQRVTRRQGMPALAVENCSVAVRHRYVNCHVTGCPWEFVWSVFNVTSTQAGVCSHFASTIGN